MFTLFSYDIAICQNLILIVSIIIINVFLINNKASCSSCLWCIQIRFFKKLLRLELNLSIQLWYLIKNLRNGDLARWPNVRTNRSVLSEWFDRLNFLFRAIKMRQWQMKPVRLRPTIQQHFIIFHLSLCVFFFFCIFATTWSQYRLSTKTPRCMLSICEAFCRNKRMIYNIFFLCLF